MNGAGTWKTIGNALPPELQRWVEDYEAEERRQRRPEFQTTGEARAMGRYASDSGGGTFQEVEPGTYVARCYRLIDLGTQHGEYKGEPTTRDQVLISFELPTEIMETANGPQPQVISKFYTNSLNEKSTLRAHLAAWRSRDFTPDELRRFDLNNVLDKPCMLAVVKNDKGKSVIAGISAMPKGMTCPPAHNPPSAFWLEEYTLEKYEALPEGIRKIIAQSDEYKELMGTGTAKDKRYPDQLHGSDDDIPF